MNKHEGVHELVEKAREKQQKAIGLTTAVVAVLTAIANLLANSANTQKVVLETKIADLGLHALQRYQCPHLHGQ